MIASEYSESEVCSYHADGDARPAGAARTVKGDPQRGAAGHSARLRCPDVAAAYQSVLRTRARRRAPARRHTGACGRLGQGTARLLPARRHRPRHRGRVARVHTAHHHLARRPAAEALGHQADADRDVAQRIRVRQSGNRDADLLRRRPRRGRHRTRRPRSGQRIEAGRQRAIRCVPQSLAPTGHRVSRDGKPRRPRDQ